MNYIKITVGTKEYYYCLEDAGMEFILTLQAMGCFRSDIKFEELEMLSM